MRALDPLNDRSFLCRGRHFSPFPIRALSSEAFALACSTVRSLKDRNRSRLETPSTFRFAVGIVDLLLSVLNTIPIDLPHHWD